MGEVTIETSLFAVLSPLQHGTIWHQHVKAGAFLFQHNLQTTHSNDTKCTNFVPFRHQLEEPGFSLENDTKFGLRGMPGGAYKLIKNVFVICQAHLQHFHCMGLREGSTGGQTQPQTCDYTTTSK